MDITRPFERVRNRLHLFKPRELTDFFYEDEISQLSHASNAYAFLFRFGNVLSERFCVQPNAWMWVDNNPPEFWEQLTEKDSIPKYFNKDNPRKYPVGLIRIREAEKSMSFDVIRTDPYLQGVEMEILTSGFSNSGLNGSPFSYNQEIRRNGKSLGHFGNVRKMLQEQHGLSPQTNPDYVLARGFDNLSKTRFFLAFGNIPMSYRESKPVRMLKDYMHIQKRMPKTIIPEWAYRIY